MRPVRYSIGIIILLSGWPTAAEAQDRIHALAAAFDVLCRTNRLDFDVLNLVASTMRYPLHDDLGQPPGKGPYRRVRTWTVPSPTGPMGLIATDANGPAGHFVACGLYAPDLSGSEALTELASALKLGKPSSVEMSVGGTKRRMTWAAATPATVIVDAVPTGNRGVIVSYEQLTKAAPP